MALGTGSFRAFEEGELRGYLGSRQDGLREEVARESEDYILNVREVDYGDYLVATYRVEPLQVDFDNPHVSKPRTELPVCRSVKAHWDNGRNGTRQYPAVIYHLPFTGDPKLLRLKTSGGPLQTIEVAVIDDCLCFEVPNRGMDPAGLKSEADRSMDLLGKWLSHSHAEVEEHNRQLPEFARRAFSQRKNAILAENQIIAALELPLIERDDLPKTFAVPPLRDRYEIAIAKPGVTEEGYSPEPTLDVASYHMVIQIIQDTLKVMERHPSLCEGKDEEALRELLLFQLTPRFEWSATAESFNRSGKTDILLRHEASNLFIAECKIWYGPSKYLAGIDQLLGYLTWRDSKAALIVFVRKREITPVLEAVKEATPTHANCLGIADVSGEAVLYYRFHIRDDPNREVKLAVLVCHIPPDA